MASINSIKKLCEISETLLQMRDESYFITQKLQGVENISSQNLINHLNLAWEHTLTAIKYMSSTLPNFVSSVASNHIYYGEKTIGDAEAKRIESIDNKKGIKCSQN